MLNSVVINILIPNLWLIFYFKVQLSGNTLLYYTVFTQFILSNYENCKFMILLFVYFGLPRPRFRVPINPIQ